MATGGIFTLITNDGKQDRMLMATKLLTNRLRLIEQNRCADPMVSDPTPTLLDIERTHVLFMNAHFKPFAAIGYEYNKVSSSAGSANFGNKVRFSIPQFGDFFHDMVLHVKLNQPTVTVTATVAGDKPTLRWCHFPGERLLQNVEFEVNGNPLDSYTQYAYNFHREFCVPPNKKTGWYRCVGQELPVSADLDNANWDSSGVYDTTLNHLLSVNLRNGHQTPKTTHGSSALEMFIPLLFWCNKDPRLAVPSVAIPYGQRFINITLATQAQMADVYVRGTTSTWAAPGGSLTAHATPIQLMELYINNIFVNPEIHDIFIKRIGFTLIRVHREQTYTADKTTDEILLQQLKWPIESMFVGMKVKKYETGTAAEVRQYLDQWHKFSSVTETTYEKVGNETAKVTAVTGTTYGTIGNADGVIASAAGTLYSTELAINDIVMVNGGLFFQVKAAPGSATAMTLEPAPNVDLVMDSMQKVVFEGMKATAKVEAPTVGNITIKAHGIPIYNDFPSAFFNSYVPYHYGGPNINTPEDLGAMMVTFNLYPGSYQPSGHINISRAREFYITYTAAATEVINSSTNGTFVVLASAINFLLISDGSAVLRYST